MIDPLLLAVGAGVALGALLLFFVARWVFERTVPARGPAEEPEGVLVQAARTPANAGGWGRRFDRGFEQVVEGGALGLTAGQALGWIMSVGVGIGVGMYLWRDEPIWGIFGFLFGAIVVVAMLLLLQHRRRLQMQEQLPDTLYFLARSLRAGLSLEQAIDLVGREGMAPLAGEIARAAGQVKLGLPVPIALEAAAERLQLLDFNVAVSTVAIFQRSGGNLPLLLDRVAAGARERNQFRGQLRTATALGRIAAFGIALATPVFLLAYLLFQPTYSQHFLENPVGWALLAVAFAMEALGLFWIHQLTKIEV